MPSKNYKSVNIHPDIHARLKGLARANRRSIGGQVEIMIEAFEASILPAVSLPCPPPGGTTQPMVILGSGSTKDCPPGGVP